MIKELIRAKYDYSFENELLEEIEKFGIYVEKERGEELINSGEYIKYFPLIITGIIKIVREDEDGKEILLYYLYPGDTCALSLTCCMSSRRSTIKAVVEDDAEIILIPIEKMDEWFSSFGSWKGFVMYTYQNRFDELLLTIEELAFNKMDQRLWAYLEKLKDAKDSSMLQITHSEIARDLGTSREVISRLLKQLEKQGKLDLFRNRIQLNVQ
ncbi:Crp/Fnr family transcriptional regulator [Membranihabitans maritimus]|uniref:Crp/Fnr family transcriptional regulator n=1 Tax=Membranihabitans maritimus TaxID=2904244 RepID=UPI001F4252BC|nr:Crp/Fnr family transcriptional regulator [Membranihabitans maritimus]